MQRREGVKNLKRSGLMSNKVHFYMLHVTVLKRNSNQNSLAIQLKNAIHIDNSDICVWLNRRIYNLIFYL